MSEETKMPDEIELTEGDLFTIAYVHQDDRSTATRYVKAPPLPANVAEAVTESCPAEDSGRVTLDTNRLADALTLSALIQSGQPKGEWIDIAADGSNLPEHVEGAEWCVKIPGGGEGWVLFTAKREWLSKPTADPLRLVTYKPVAFWSVPYIPTTCPDIPAYQPKEQRDEQ